MQCLQRLIKREENGNESHLLRQAKIALVAFLKSCDIISAVACGEVAEWSKAGAWRASGPRGPVGSNPTFSASFFESKVQKSLSFIFPYQTKCFSETSEFYKER